MSEIIITDDEIFSENSNVVPIKPHPEMDGINLLGHTMIKESITKETEFVLFPWLPKQGISFVYAATGFGKTLFAMNVAYCIAKSGHFLNFKCPQPRKVLYIDGEMPLIQVENRYKKIIQEQGDLLFPENFTLLNTEAILPRKLPKICTPEGQRYYTDLFMREKYEVVILDNLSMLTDIDENSSKEWKQVQDWLLHIRSIGLSVIILHHAGKIQTGFRGTSRMLDCADSAISLTKIDNFVFESDVQNLTRFKLAYEKNRHFGGKDALPMDVCYENQKWVYRSIELERMDKAIICFKANMSQSETAREMGINQSSVSRLLDKAEKHKLIKRDQKGKVMRA